MINALGAVDIRVLRNEAIPIERDGDRSWLAGIKDVLVKRGADLPSALRPIPSGEPVVLLAHEPDYADYAARYPVDLQLSGHSHGGQIRLPSVGRFTCLPWRGSITRVCTRSAI